MLIEYEDVVSGGCTLSETAQRKEKQMRGEIIVDGKKMTTIELVELYLETKNDLTVANQLIDAKQREIEELETELRVKEDLFKIKGVISGEQPSAEWYEQRYQSDCITINQLHTTIDVLTDKLARLRGQMGL